MLIRNHRGTLYTSLGILAILCLMLTSSCKEEKESLNTPDIKKKEVAVVIQDNTAMRVDPLLYSARVAILKRAEVVQLLDISKGKATIGKDRDYWYKIRTESGFVGWVYGSNIKKFSNKSKSTIDRYISSFWEEEASKFKGKLSGKWWSIDSRGDFTNHGLELGDDGNYKSYTKGGGEIKGQYNINFSANEIMFLNGTSFKSNLNFIKRGTEYFLEKVTDNSEIKFKKISSVLEENLKAKDSAEEGQDENPNQ